MTVTARSCSPWSRAALARAVLSLALAAALLSGCAAGELSGDAAHPPRALYRPGESLDARLCECRECFERACCTGDPERVETSSETELGLAVNACGRCLRRTWTVRGNTECLARAPSECCEGSISS